MLLLLLLLMLLLALLPDQVEQAHRGCRLLRAPFHRSSPGYSAPVLALKVHRECAHR